MNLKSKIHAFKLWLLRFIQLQLFITIVSLPFLLVWGLPVSLLSPVGNLIFSPVLTLFLFLCSLIFFCELVHIPNTVFITALEKVTDWWFTIMFSDSQTWLVGFIKPSLIIMVAMPVLAFIIIIHKKTRHLYQSITLLSLLSIGISVYLKCAAPAQTSRLEIPCNRGQLTIIQRNGIITVIDPGYLGQKINAASWAQYTFMPTLIRETGSTTIDNLILMQPSTMLFQAVERLATKMTIKNIYLTCWQGHASASFMRSFFDFKRTLSEHGTNLIRLNKKPYTVNIGPAAPLAITPLEKTIKTADISYPAVLAEGYIDNQEITLYSAKYAKNLISSSKRKTE